MSGGWGKGVVEEGLELFVYERGGGFLVCVEKKGFCGQRRFEFGRKRKGQEGDFTDCGKN